MATHCWEQTKLSAYCDEVFVFQIIKRWSWEHRWKTALVLPCTFVIANRMCDVENLRKAKRISAGKVVHMDFEQCVLVANWMLYFGCLTCNNGTDSSLLLSLSVLISDQPLVAISFEHIFTIIRLFRAVYLFAFNGQNFTEKCALILRHCTNVISRYTPFATLYTARAASKLYTNDEPKQQRHICKTVNGFVSLKQIRICPLFYFAFWRFWFGTIVSRFWGAIFRFESSFPLLLFRALPPDDIFEMQILR